MAAAVSLREHPNPSRRKLRHRVVVTDSRGRELALLAVTPLQAQDITIGVKGGLNIADLSVDDPLESADLDTRSAFVGGAYADFGLGGFFSIQPEVLFSQKGATETEGDFTAAFKLSYIEIPVLLKARFDIPDSPIRPMLYVAPVVAFESKCEIEASADGASVSADCDQISELSDGEVPDLKTKSTDFGIGFGGGLDVMAGPVVLTGDVRYTLGLTNINDTSGAEDVDVKNRAWQLFVGVGFPLM
jgi:hypothetical protein